MLPVSTEYCAQGGGGRFKGAVDIDRKVRLDGKVERVGVEYPKQDSMGFVARAASRDAGGDLYVENLHFVLPDDDRKLGFAGALTKQLEDFYRRCEVRYVTVFASDEVGGYVWARQGFQWDERGLGVSIRSVMARLRTVRADASTTAADRTIIDVMMSRLDDENGQVRPLHLLPKPSAIAGMESEDSPDLGKTVMMGASWFGIKYL